jgi:hypothetical protein
MPRYKNVIILDRKRLNEEYHEAHFARVWAVPRIIRNPRGAAAVKDVIDQIPQVKADLDAKLGRWES